MHQYPNDVATRYYYDSVLLLPLLLWFRTNTACAEFDSIASSRGGSDDGMQARRILSELLIQMTLNKQLAKQQQQQHRIVVEPSKAGATAVAATEPGYEQQHYHCKYSILHHFPESFM